MTTTEVLNTVEGACADLARDGEPITFTQVAATTGLARTTSTTPMAHSAHSPTSSRLFASQCSQGCSAIYRTPIQHRTSPLGTRVSDATGSPRRVPKLDGGRLNYS